MKALVYEGVETLTYRDAPDPVTPEGSHLVKVEAVGICGSDMHGYLGHDSRRPAPLILGHEAAGVITGGPMDGRRVTVNPLVPCGVCAYCKAGREHICQDRQLISMPPREGAFAQYLTMPEANLVTVPDDIALSRAALAEPLSVSWHAANLALNALHPGMDRRAIVLGGGAIGLAASLALKAMGVDDVTVVEPNEIRRKVLLDHGETAVAEAQGMAPIVMDAVGYAATRKVASAIAEAGGVIVHIGLGEDMGGVDIRRLTLQEITFIGSYCYSPAEFRDCAQALFDGRLGPLDWAEHRALAEGAGAFADMRAGRVAAPKIILHPWEL